MTGDPWADWIPPRTRWGSVSFGSGLDRSLGETDQSEAPPGAGGGAIGGGTQKKEKVKTPPLEDHRKTANTPIQWTAKTDRTPPPPATFADDPRLAELLALLHLGLLSNRVGTRVAEITRDNHPDALARLERAANHLHLTGSNATTLLARSIAHGPQPARDYLAQPRTENTP